MNKNSHGQVLIGVIAFFTFLLIITPAVIKWIQQESIWATTERRESKAFNLAEAAVERGVWKLKSSTETFANARSGVIISSYNFDTSFLDVVSGGNYRIRFTAGPGTNQVTVTGEGRDLAKKEVRAVQAVYENQSIPGPLLTTGNIGLSGVFEPHWGPVMAQGNITISGAAAANSFPRKMSKGVVSSLVAPSRDTNGLTPPNTDNVEWWSGYNVPDLPVLDFTTMRASAAANGTLNYYNVNTSSTGHVLTGYSGGHYNDCRTPTDGAFASHANHFYDPEHHPRSKSNLIWYWDGDVILTGGCWVSGSCDGTSHRMGLRGTFIIRGNLTIATGDNYTIANAPVPSTAWREYQRIDTSSANQYPADNGLRANRSTFNMGSESWTGGPSTTNTDVGIRGFIYVGGNFSILTNGMGDFFGALWIVGNATNANTAEKSLVFFDSSLDVPVLNVVLVQQSWREITPSTAVAWP